MKKYVPLAEAKQLFKQLTGVKSWLHYRQVVAEYDFEWKQEDVILVGMKRLYSVESVERFAAFLIDNNLIGRNLKTE